MTAKNLNFVKKLLPDALMVPTNGWIETLSSVKDAGEIANASESLKTLDKNGDGKLTEDELHSPRPEGKDGPRGPGGKGPKQ